jgi:hypothetical protein
MPFFDVRCDIHGRQEVTSVSQGCPLCGKKVKRLWTAPPKIVVDFRDGWDMGAGKYFNTKMERDNWVAEKGIRRIRD